MKKLVFLGKRGRTTIPLIMRFRHDYHDNDLIHLRITRTVQLLFVMSVCVTRTAPLTVLIHLHCMTL